MDVGTRIKSSTLRLLMYCSALPEDPVLCSEPRRKFVTLLSKIFGEIQTSIMDFSVTGLTRYFIRRPSIKISVTTAAVGLMWTMTSFGDLRNKAVVTERSLLIADDGRLRRFNDIRNTVSTYDNSSCRNVITFRDLYHFCSRTRLFALLCWIRMAGI